MGPADADVDELGPVAQGDLAGLVDAIPANPVVRGDGEPGAAGRGLGASVERLCRCPPGQRPVRSDVVVVIAEAVELGLQLGQGGGRGLFGEPAFEGLVEALDLAARLGVIGAGVLVVDPQPDELELDGTAAVAALGSEDRPVVGEHRGGIAPGGGAEMERGDHVSGLGGHERSGGDHAAGSGRRAR